MKRSPNPASLIDRSVYEEFRRMGGKSRSANTGGKKEESSPRERSSVFGTEQSQPSEVGGRGAEWASGLRAGVEGNLPTGHQGVTAKRHEQGFVDISDLAAAANKIGNLFSPTTG